MMVRHFAAQPIYRYRADPFSGFWLLVNVLLITFVVFCWRAAYIVILFIYSP